MTGRLNLFQKTMLQWNELHPYNAVHLVRLAGAPDLRQLTRAIGHMLERRGLSGFTLNRARGTFSYHAGPASVDVPIVSGGNNPQQALASEIERQLNMPFALDGPFLPFRFFVVPEAKSFTVGLAYFHAVADADAVVQLLKEIVAACERSNGATAPSTTDLYPSRHDNLLRRCPGVLVRRLAALPEFVRKMRCSSRPRVQNPDDFKIGFTYFSSSEENLSTLKRTTKNWDVTVHDLFLTLLLKGVGALSPERTRATRRKEFSVGTIVNIRKDLGMESARSFGLFLGSFVVTHPVPAGIGIRQLATDIRLQTARIKRSRLYLGTPLELATVRLALSFFSTAGKRKFYQKHYPLWGGITNMNLNALWSQQDGGPRITDYARAVSTGPATPLVLSITTFGERVNVGLSYRTTVFSTENVARFKNDFLTALRDPEAMA